MRLSLFPKGRLAPRQPSDCTSTRGRCFEPVVAISVDVLRPPAGGADAQQKLHAAGRALHNLLIERGLPATWGLSEPLTSPFVNQLCSGRRALLSHEIAMRLEGLGSNPHPRRTALAEALARHLSQAEACGLVVTTVFAEPRLLAANLDLLVKRGVTAVREIAASPARWAGASLSPRQLRYGLWGFPLAHTLPADGSVSGLQRRLLTGRQAAEAGRGGCVLHVGIEMGGLVAGDRGAWRAMEKGLRHLARLRAEEGVRVECLRTVAARLSAVPIAAPQQSILRRAA